MPYTTVCDIAAKRESGTAEPLFIMVSDLVAPCHRHVVHHPLLHVVFMNALPKKLQFPLILLGRGVSFGAKDNGCIHILPKSHLQKESLNEPHPHQGDNEPHPHQE